MVTVSGSSTALEKNINFDLGNAKKVSTFQSSCRSSYGRKCLWFNERKGNVRKIFRSHFCISITRLLLRRGRKERNAFSGPKFPFFKFPEGTERDCPPSHLTYVRPGRQGDRVAIFRSFTGLKMFMLKVKTTCLVSCSGESLNKFAFLFLQM